jgi:hypothetical protein
MIQDLTDGAGAGDGESDDALRRVYGPNVVISRVGKFTLVHLDSPTPEVVARRETEFDPAEFFFDECPLCEIARQEGGHIVYDAVPEADQSDAEEDVLGEPLSPPYWLKGTGDAASSPAAFNQALGNLLSAAEEFAKAAERRGLGDLAARYDEDVVGLHDRLIEVLWSEESSRRVELFEVQIARAREVVDEVCALEPDLEQKAAGVRGALDEVAVAWKKL